MMTGSSMGEAAAMPPLSQKAKGKQPVKASSNWLQLQKVRRRLVDSLRRPLTCSILT